LQELEVKGLLDKFDIIVHNFVISLPSLSILEPVWISSIRGQLIRDIFRAFPEHSIITRNIYSLILFDDTNKLPSDIMLERKLNSRIELTTLFEIENNIRGLNSRRFTRYTGFLITDTDLNNIKSSIAKSIENFVWSNPFTKTGKPYYKVGMNYDEFLTHYRLLRNIYFSFRSFSDSQTWTQISKIAGGTTKLTDFLTRGARLDDKIIKAFIKIIQEHKSDIKVVLYKDTIDMLRNYQSNLPLMKQIAPSEYHPDFHTEWMERYLYFTLLSMYAGFDPLHFGPLENELFREGGFKRMENGEEKSRNTALHHWLLSIKADDRKKSTHPAEIILTSNQYHKAYDSKNFKDVVGEARMRRILDCFLSLVAMEGDVSLQDVKDAMSSISDLRTRQILEGYWLVGDSKFQVSLDKFNIFRREIRNQGVNYFLEHRYSEAYNRYNGVQFTEFLNSLEPATSTNSFEEIDYWSEYFTSSIVFREYIRYLGNELGYTVHASWW